MESQSAFTPARGWVRNSPIRGMSTGPNTNVTGVTTDAEGINGHYRISTMEDGVFEWNGSYWVSLMTPTADCPNCGLDGTLPTPPPPGYGLSTNTFAQRPGDVNTILAGTAADTHSGRGGSVGSGLWRGQWNGTAWRWANVLAAKTAGDVFKVRWSDANTVHVATTTGYFVSRSQGQAGTWTHALSQRSTDLAVVNSTYVFLASSGIGLQKIEWVLQGSTWSHSESTIVSNTIAGRSVVAIVQPPEAANFGYYMAGMSGGGIQGLWQIYNDSAFQIPNCTSTPWNGCFPASVLGSQSDWDIALTINPANPNQVAAACTALVQTQDGTLWNGGTGDLHGDVHALTWDTSGNVLAGSDGGYYYSSDGGQSWHSDSNTSDMVSLTDFDLSPDGIVLGTAWDTLGFDGLGHASVGGVGDGYFEVADPGSPGQFWSTGNTGAGGNCCGHTKDYGASGTRCEVVPGKCGSGRVQHDHTPPINIYMLSNTGNPSAVYTSTSADGGQNWTRLSALAPEPLYDIGVGTRGTGGAYVYASNNATRKKLFVLHPLSATSWSDITSKLSLKGTITRIATHPGTSSSQTQTAWVLGAGPAQILKTTNGGGTWTDVTGNLPTSDPSFGPQDIAIDPVTNALYLATSAGVYKSTDGGTHWTRWTLNLPGNGTQMALTLHTTDRRSQGGIFAVWAGLYGSGVWWRDGTE